MKRSMWTGAIAFGLVNVPVKLYSAIAQREQLHFHLVHDADGGRIKEKRVCEKDGKEVAWEHVVRGFELPNHHDVMFTPDELAALLPEATKTIEIENFVELAEIDPIYYNHTYYVVPEKNAAKAYALLLETMRDEKKVGIARVVLRTKQYLCSLRPMDKVLALSTMQFAHEVVDPSDLPGDSKGSAKIASAERAMATQLLQSMTKPFRPEQYKDEYHAQVLALVKKKAKGQTLVEPAPETAEKGGKLIDLMATLRASLAKGNAHARRAGSPRRAAPATRRHRARR